MKKSFKQQILDQLDNMSDSNPKRYWSLVKELKEIDANSVTGTNPISPEDWLKHFSKLLFHEKQDRSSQLEEKINEMLSRDTFSDLDFRITKDVIKKAISSLKSGKANKLRNGKCFFTCFIIC